jgi:broad specificity phosphatase PhoE
MTANGGSGRLLLVRHTAVAGIWRTRCYGSTDVPLGLEGTREARRLTAELCFWCPQLVISSPLRRARFLGASIARAARVPLHIDARLSERDFGDWEGRTWDDIHAETGDAMMGMLTAPDRYRPGGGETTSEMQRRVLAWRAGLPDEISIIAICHGGPIGALVGTARGLAPKDWPQCIPAPGGCVDLTGAGPIPSIVHPSSGSAL